MKINYNINPLKKKTLKMTGFLIIATRRESAISIITFGESFRPVQLLSTEF